MSSKLESAGFITGHPIHVRFAGGTESGVDLKDDLRGEVFESLKDPELFRRFQLDQGLSAVTGPPGANLARESLYEKAAAQQTDAVDRPSAARGSAMRWAAKRRSRCSG